MNILTLDNESFSLNNLPEQIEDDIRFSVLDNSDPNQILFNLRIIECREAIVMEINGQK